MKIYFAGYLFPGPNLIRFAKIATHRLISLEYYKEIPLWFDAMRATGRTSDLIIDSGAYSAFRKGTTLDLQKLMKDCDEVRRLGAGLLEEFHLVNADVIPGEPKRIATRDEVLHAADASLDNWRVLSQNGFDTLPVHHQGEPFSYIDEYVREGARYLCFAPAKDASTKMKAHYLEDAFDHVKGWGVKIHGLGLTAQELLEGFPWYSVDSTTAQWNAKYGKVWVWNNHDLTLVHLTEGLIKHGGNVHYLLAPAVIRTHMDKLFTSHGSTYQRLRDEFEERVLFSACSFTEYERYLDGIDNVCKLDEEEVST